MNNTITSTNFNFPNQTNFYKGKVRDVYSINEDKLIMVASDRISAFDHVLPKGIPYKGQVLSQIAAKFLKATSDILPNWMEATPDPSVTIYPEIGEIVITESTPGTLSGTFRFNAFTSDGLNSVGFNEGVFYRVSIIN